MFSLRGARFLPAEALPSPKGDRGSVLVATVRPDIILQISETESTTTAD